MTQTQNFVQDLKDEMQYEKRYKYQVPFEKSEYNKTLTQVIETSLFLVPIRPRW